MTQISIGFWLNWRNKLLKGSIIATIIKLSKTNFGDKYSAFGNLTPFEDAKIKKRITPTTDKIILAVLLVDKNQGTTIKIPVKA